MADTTLTTASPWIPAVWSELPTITYRSNLVNVNCLDRRWEPEIGVGRGNTVNIPGFTQNNTASNRGAGTGTFGTGATITFSAATETQTQLLINRLYYKAFRDPVELLGVMMSKYTQLRLEGNALACALQVDADVASDSTNGFAAFTTSVGTDNVDITEDDLITCETNLSNNNAPATRGDNFLVISPATRGSAIKIESLRNVWYRDSIGNLMGDRNRGYIGPAYRFDVMESNNLAAGTAGKKNAAFHREAIAYAEQMKLMTEHTLNLQDGGYHQYMTFMTCGFKRVKDLFGNLLLGK